MSDLSNIQNDIERNIANIIKNIRIEPFKAIISKYATKVSSVEDFITKNQKTSVSINKLPSFNSRTIDKLVPTFASLYSPIKLTTGVIKKTDGPAGTGYITNRSGTAGEDELNLEKSSVYISFENKEMFENAMASSVDEHSTRRLSDY